MNTFSFFMMLVALVAFSLPSSAAPLNMFMYTKRISEVANCIEIGSNQGQLAADALTCDNVLHRRNMPRGLELMIQNKRGSPECPAGELNDAYEKYFQIAFHEEFEDRFDECSAGN